MSQTSSSIERDAEIFHQGAVGIQSMSGFRISFRAKDNGQTETKIFGD
jgi:hypothetical protein